MDLRHLLPVLLDDAGLRRAVTSAVSAGTTVGLELGAPGPMRPVVVATLAAAAPDGAGRMVLAVTATDREAADLAAALESLLPPHCVAEYPAWETLPHERLSPRADTVGRRLAVRRRLRHPMADDDPSSAAGGAFAWWSTGSQPAPAASRRSW